MRSNCIQYEMSDRVGILPVLRAEKFYLYARGNFSIAAIK